MQLFFTTNFKDGFGQLDEFDSRHCVRVLRKKVGDVLWMTDGKGHLYKTKLQNTNPKACEFKIIETQTQEQRSEHRLHLAIAPTKQISRFEWFLEKAVEIGIDEITPLVSKYSERDRIKPERLQKILIAAMKQSLQTFLPQLNPITPLSDFLAQEQNKFNKYIAWTAEPSNNLEKQFQKGNSLFLIGPEGGFSEAEVTQAIEQGFQSISLGKNRLRTETAGVVVCQTVKTLSVI